MVRVSVDGVRYRWPARAFRSASTSWPRTLDIERGRKSRSAAAVRSLFRLRYRVLGSAFERVITQAGLAFSNCQKRIGLQHLDAVSPKRGGCDLLAPIGRQIMAALCLTRVQCPRIVRGMFRGANAQPQNQPRRVSLARIKKKKKTKKKKKNKARRYVPFAPNRCRHRAECNLERMIGFELVKMR